MVTVVGDENRKVIINGKLIDWENAKVHVSTHGLLYGSGVFEGIRAYIGPDGKQLYIFRLKEHVRRIFNNAKILGLKPAITEKEFSDQIVELLRVNNHKKDVYIRPVIYFGEGGVGIKPGNRSTDYFIFTQEMGGYFTSKKALDVCISSWTRISNNSLPPSAKVTGAYVNSMIASAAAAESGFDEAIFLTHNGYVCEGAGENIFMVKNSTLITPPVSADILEGITRDAVIRLSGELNIPVLERDVARTELYTCDELFFCGTAAQITPVGSVDRKPVGDGQKGKITGRLADAFEAVIRGNDPKHKSWLTPVHMQVVENKA